MGISKIGKVKYAAKKVKLLIAIVIDKIKVDIDIPPIHYKRICLLDVFSIARCIWASHRLHLHLERITYSFVRKRIYMIIGFVQIRKNND